MKHLGKKILYSFHMNSDTKKLFVLVAACYKTKPTVYIRELLRERLEHDIKILKLDIPEDIPTIENLTSNQLHELLDLAKRYKKEEMEKSNNKAW